MGFIDHLALNFYTAAKEKAAQKVCGKAVKRSKAPSDGSESESESETSLRHRQKALRALGREGANAGAASAARPSKRPDAQQGVADEAEEEEEEEEEDTGRLGFRRPGKRVAAADFVVSDDEVSSSG